MGDTEMHEQDVASGLYAGSVEARGPNQEPSEPDQNPIEKPLSPVPEDKTLTLESDVHLPDAAVDDETGADEVTDNHASVDGKSADQSINKSVGDDGHEEEKPEELTPPQVEHSTPDAGGGSTKKWRTWLLSKSEVVEADESGSLEEQDAFIKEVESFHREHFLEFKAPKFYGQPLNCLKLWRAVIKLGGYDVVTSSKLWRQVGESFHPPKTCTTVSWTFRIFYEKALLEYEKFLRQHGELTLPGSAFFPSSDVEKEVNSHLGPGSGRTRRDAAARAMQGWHSHRLLGSGEDPESISKDKGLNSTPRQKNLKSVQKHKTPTSMDLVVSHEGGKQLVAEVIDVGLPADWVKINVRETKDCFEIYALVPGLLREEVRVQSDPAGKLVITGQPEQLENPWGITSFKKIVSLPARIDPLHTSAVVSFHGRLFVRVPFEQ
ncbi:PREDICTED: AT-rich interactive domain-containing protein 5-like isoform X2 [Tarenaya hassleriana]|uniref:AT-rich interactive domain-containing protein 5-like isoform X2 n=1 Tax=Tarenaya hassleriana TaxID=28532 RepID=UPI00053C187C|nr:PREDICTED: AT-rich interactive domain-containing protein 5-like isoform X2 [Tarenaya hassleriana]